MTPSSRSDALYQLGLEKYTEVVDLELGTSNAIIAAIAVMIADSEKLRTWKTPALIGDPVEPDEAAPLFAGSEETTNLRKPGSAQRVLPQQLELGDW